MLAPSPLAAQDIDIEYDGDSLLLTYRKGFGANVTLQTSSDLFSWNLSQTEEEVVAMDSEGEIITSSWAIEHGPRQFFRLSIAKAWSVTLAWDTPSDPSISGYMLHYGTSSNSYTQQIDVGYTPQATIFLPQSMSVCFLVVTAYNAARVESSPSNELKIYKYIPEFALED